MLMAKLDVTIEEWTEHMAVAEVLPNAELAKELERLAEREREILNAADVNEAGYEEFREITLYNITVLAASSARLIMASTVSPARKRERGPKTRKGRREAHGPQK